MRVSRVIAAATVAGLVLTSCGAGDGDSDGGATPETSATTTDDGLTAPGTELDLGRPAKVMFEAGPKHTSEISVAVTRVEKGSIKDFTGFDLPDRVSDAGVYYVRAKVQNTGKGDLSGARLVLFGKVSDTQVVQPVTLRSAFARCSYQPLPKKFKHGAKTNVCLVLMTPDHAKISAVQWRADDVEPISWPAK